MDRYRIIDQATGVVEEGWVEEPAQVDTLSVLAEIGAALSGVTPSSNAAAVRSALLGIKAAIEAAGIGEA